MLNRTPVVYARSEDVVLTAAPINPDWVLVGSPKARAAMLAKSPDNEAVTMAWDCTAGVFRWHFDCDETVHIIEGSVTVHWNGERFTLGAGDCAYFPARSVATWTVHNYVRKVAFIRIPPPAVVSYGLRAVRLLKRLALGRWGNRPATALTLQNG